MNSYHQLLSQENLYYINTVVVPTNKDLLLT